MESAVTDGGLSGSVAESEAGVAASIPSGGIEPVGGILEPAAEAKRSRVVIYHKVLY